ncbi:MAG: TrkH family potassium uptake protein [Bacteroidaceae bacterium]|nr:TrkH family potassium uptake protein [Bacteroidaceae bacterium]
MKKSIFGTLILMEALFLALSTAVALLYGESDWKAFLPTTVLAVVVGSVCRWWGGRSADKHMSRTDSYMVVTLSWIVFSVIGMVPFILHEGMDVASAFFETMSGFTTTGATCIDDIDRMPHALRFWRSLTQWMGGLGIVVFSFALIPVYEMKNSNVFSAEVTGIGLDRLRPKIGDTARRLLVIYLCFTAVCAALYWLGPMNLYDAVCHSMSTVATGGFSTHSASIGYFHSAYVEYVCSVFMLICSVNFSLYYYVTIRRPRAFYGNEELRAFLLIVAAMVVWFVCLFYHATVGDVGERLPRGFEECFRTALFHVSSVMTSTGFSAETFDYVAWGSNFWMPTVLIMAIGGCAGSTAGGLKVIRVLMCCKATVNEFIRQMHPRAVLGIRISGQIVPDERVRRTLAFFFIYICLIVIGMMVHPLLGADVDTAMGTCVSMLSNMGPGTGTVGPASTFSHVPAAGKWMMSAYMLMGRLEFYTVLFLFLPQYWKEQK